jgi:hypothetical protein
VTRRPQRAHKVVLNVTFNRGCTPAEAAEMIKDTIGGEYFPTSRRTDGPDFLKVRSASKWPPAIKKRPT